MQPTSRLAVKVLHNVMISNCPMRLLRGSNDVISLPDLNNERGDVLGVPYPQGELWRGWLVHADLLRAVSSGSWLLSRIYGDVEKLVYYNNRARGIIVQMHYILRYNIRDCCYCEYAFKLCIIVIFT